MSDYKSQAVFDKYKASSQSDESINSGNTVRFTVDGINLIIKKWSIKEVMSRAAIVSHLFVLPQTTMANNLHVGMEDEDLVVDMSTVMYAYINALSQIDDMGMFLDDMTSCVFVEDTEKQLNVDTDLKNKPENLCKVLQEVLNCHFLFLFNGVLANLLWTGKTAAEMSTAVFQEQ